MNAYQLCKSPCEIQDDGGIVLYERIFRSFQETGLRYAVIGGIAVNLHGYNRLTGDLDIITSLDDNNLNKFLSVVSSLGLVPRLPVSLADFANSNVRASWVADKNMKVFSVYNPNNPLEHVDIKIDTPQKIEAYIDRAERIDTGDFVIYVVTINDLIELKREAGRERDLVDIRALERIKQLDEEG